MDQSVSFVHDIDNFSYEQPVSETDPRSRFCLTTGFHERFPHIIRSSFQKKHFDLRSGFFFCSDQSGRDYLCIIYHETIAFIQIIDNLTEYMMSDLTGFFVHCHKSGRGTVFKRILRDQLLRKIIIKITCFHIRFISCYF